MHTLSLLAIALCAALALAEPLIYEGETHLRNVRQLTFGGENAEAYFSYDGDLIVYQATRDSFKCDQIFTMNLDGSGQQLISTGTGATTCSFFVPGTEDIVFCSTHEHGAECPVKPDRALGYVWGLFNYDVFRAKRDGSNLRVLANSSGYDAEAAVSPDGKEVVFTSARDGDLELYKMNSDGTNIRRLTYTVGYDGGPFFSPDGKYIVYRAFHPRSPEELVRWNTLWSEQAVSPTRLELWIMNSDGTGQRQVTNLGAASFCPYMSPDGSWIVFTSNFADSSGSHMPNFDLWRIHPDGSGLDRVSNSPVFDGFPMWSYDGKKLIFASNRGEQKHSHETNIFIADWIE
ncbi:PD40 domain-containing protein [candidate division KSB1 bacterium]|nr:PD40 domain-containing protein [candidate division KSB1 bacterium]